MNNSIHCSRSKCKNSKNNVQLQCNEMPSTVQTSQLFITSVKKNTTQPTFSLSND